jgi:hypothetical protein
LFVATGVAEAGHAKLDTRTTDNAIVAPLAHLIVAAS